jgi:hypothetical protein
VTFYGDRKQGSKFLHTSHLFFKIWENYSFGRNFLLEEGYKIVKDNPVILNLCGNDYLKEKKIKQLFIAMQLLTPSEADILG